MEHLAQRHLTPQPARQEGGTHRPLVTVVRISGRIGVRAVERLKERWSEPAVS